MQHNTPHPDTAAVVLAFDTDDDEFARGFEAGRIDGILGVNGGASYTQPVSGRNAEMMARIAARHQRSIIVEDTPGAGDWMVARFGPAGTGA